MAQSIPESDHRSLTDLSNRINRDQATWELRRALDSGDDLWLARWARHWGEPAMRALMTPLTPPP